MTAIRRNVVIPEDHRLHLEIDLPPELPAGDAEMTLVISPLRQPNKVRAIEWLRELSRSGGVRSISDPATWQREVRRERPLPGRV
jgi:hypothetical protein